MRQFNLFQVTSCAALLFTATALSAAGVDNGMMPLPTLYFGPNSTGSAVVPTHSLSAYHRFLEPLRLTSQLGYFNDYWFRYHDVAPNRLNIQNITELSWNMKNLGSLYLRTFADYSNDVRTPYLNGLAQGIAGTPVAGGQTGFVPASAFTELDVTAGYQYDIMNLLRFDTAYTNFITPANQIFVPGGNPLNSTGIGRGQTDSQEISLRLSLNDTPYLHDFAFQPFVMVGFDYDGSYYTSGAGQYFEVGINPVFVVPHTGGLTIYSPVSVSFTHNEKRLDVNQHSYRDGYLGTFVGTTITYPLNGLLNIPDNCGHYEIGGVADSVFAATRLSQPTGSHSDATILGLFVRVSY